MSGHELFQESFNQDTAAKQPIFSADSQSAGSIKLTIDGVSIPLQSDATLADAIGEINNRQSAKKAEITVAGEVKGARNTQGFSLNKASCETSIKNGGNGFIIFRDGQKFTVEKGTLKIEFWGSGFPVFLHIFRQAAVEYGATEDSVQATLLNEFTDGNVYYVNSEGRGNTTISGGIVDSINNKDNSTANIFLVVI